MQAAGYAEIPFSALSNAVKGFPAATALPVVAEDISFSVAEAHRKRVPIGDYSAGLVYMVSIA